MRIRNLLVAMRVGLLTAIWLSGLGHWAGSVLWPRALRAILFLTSTQRTLEALWRARVPFTLTQDGYGWAMTFKQEPDGVVLTGRARTLSEAVAWVEDHVRRGLVRTIPTQVDDGKA